MSYRNLHSRRTLSDPAVPSALNPSTRIGKSDTRSDSPLTPIESEGLSRVPSPKGQGYESALSEPEEAESGGLAEKISDSSQTSETTGGRVDPSGDLISNQMRTDEPAVNMKSVSNVHNRNSLSSEQELTIKMAEANLDPEQRELIDRRQSSVRIMDVDEVSHGEDSSSGKGKGIDPRNWGNVALDSDESNPEVQAQILASIGETSKKREASRERRMNIQDMFEEFQPWQRQETQRIEERYQSKLDALKKAYMHQGITEAEALEHPEGSTTEEPEIKGEEKVRSYENTTRRLPSRPSELIATTSHVGKLFNQLTAVKRSGDVPREETEEDPLEDVGSTARKAKGMRIKPLKPTEIYDGTASLCSFQRNMREIIAYLEDGQVPEYRQIEVASRFLKGKAYTFFERTCGESSSDWTLKKFYERLYDFAFPIDF
ncbi:hypothetical protein GGU10DRAFT_370579 [Lentinula aff. detonsa]|uniref:Uncharacterized protein n=1 Tax=Lentinula aff. detonsa TaxID=2804958 RepID=A0AA38U156_9AGAR|nr:hypothetical protein GGU10DRAFT_370579 [Lentinula aff. detonsa]